MSPNGDFRLASPGTDSYGELGIHDDVWLLILSGGQRALLWIGEGLVVRYERDSDGARAAD